MQYRYSGLGLLSLAASTVLAIPHNHANGHAQLHQAKRGSAAPYDMGNGTAPLYAPTGAIPAAEASTLSLTQTVDVTQYYTQTKSGNRHHASAASAAAAESAAAASSPASVAAADVSATASSEACFETEVTVTVTPQPVTVTVTAASEDTSSSAVAASTPVYVAPSSAAVSSVEAASSTQVYVAPSSAVKTSSVEAASSTPVYVAPSSAAVAASSVAESSSPAYVAPVSSAAADVSSYIASVVATSSAAASSTVASSTAASSATSTSTSSSDNVAKKGLVYNDISYLSDFTSSGTIGWVWNWGSTPDGDVPSSVEYVPCIQNAEGMTDWDSNVETQLSAGSTALMSFNEPDVLSSDGGSDLTPAQAAEYYKTTMETYSSKAKLVSPSVCNGNGIRADTGTVQGLDWLLEFMSDENCGSCTVDYYAIHWYETYSSDNDVDACVAGFKNHVWNATNIWAGDESKVKPVWITEFALDGADTATEAQFLQEVISWMAEDNQSYIDRYSYYKADTLATVSSLMSAYSS